MIQSILDQTYPHSEIIVVDDGSIDDTADVRCKLNDDGVRLIRHTKNAGVPAARNAGVTAATGDLISFLDSDDLWKISKLEVEVAFLAGHPEADAVLTALTF